MAEANILIRKLKSHSQLSHDDAQAIVRLPFRPQLIEKGDDIVRQGDKPTHSVLVLRGFVARYQNLPNGRRQYISYNIAGDLPDAQTLFIERLDHAVCAITQCEIATIPHKAIKSLFERSPK